MNATEPTPPQESPSATAPSGVEIEALQDRLTQLRGGAPAPRNPAGSSLPPRADAAPRHAPPPMAEVEIRREAVRVHCATEGCTTQEQLFAEEDTRGLHPIGTTEPGEFVYTRWFSGERRLDGAADPRFCPACLAAEDRRRAEEERALDAALAADVVTEPAGQPDRRAVSLLDQVRAAGGDPWEFGRYTLETFDAWGGRELALGAARVFARQVRERTHPYDRVTNLLLWGPTGTAKTELMHCILMDLLASGSKPGRGGVMYLDFGSFVTQVQDTYEAGEKTWPLIEPAMEADVLIVDELFGDKVTADTVRIALLILNRRLGRPTALTQNPDPNELVERYAPSADQAARDPKLAQFADNLDRLVSRLGKFRRVRLRGEDARPLVSQLRTPGAT